MKEPQAASGAAHSIFALPYVRAIAPYLPGKPIER